MNAKRSCLAAIAVVVAVGGNVALAIDRPKAKPIGGLIKWVYDYEQGKRVSRTSGKPMFVVFRCER